MATRSFIIVEVPNEMRGKRVNLNIDKLPNGIKRENEDGEIKLPPCIYLTKRYIGVYHHWDGHVESLGERLFDSYNSLDKALNLISGGDISTTMDNADPKVNRTYDKVNYYFTSNSQQNWKNNAPFRTDDLDSIDTRMICFVYLFRNGKWYYREYNERDFKLVKEYLDSMEE